MAIEIKNIQFKRGSKAALIANLVGDNRLKYGEPAFEKDTGQLKIGNGEQDYINLPYVGGQGGGGEDPRFIIQDPLENQVLLYDSTLGKWINKDLADNDSIIYLAEHGLTIKGYDTAVNGQMLVKDSIAGLVWRDPVTTEQLSGYVQAAEAASSQAGQYATIAGNKAIEADTSARTAQSINQQTMSWVNNKFWWGTLSEYNALPTISPSTFYFITADDTIKDNTN